MRFEDKEILSICKNTISLLYWSRLYLIIGCMIWIFFSILEWSYHIHVYIVLGTET